MENPSENLTYKSKPPHLLVTPNAFWPTASCSFGQEAFNASAVERGERHQGVTNGAK